MKRQSFSFFLGISLSLHTLLFVFFALPGFGNFFSRKRVIAPSVKVSMIGMPKKQAITATPKKSPLPKKTQSAVKKKPKPKKKAEKKKPKLSKKKVSSKKKPQKEKPKKPPTKKAAIQKKELETRKGNQISEGKGREGDATDERGMEQLRSYIAGIIEQIRFNWNLPKHLTDKYFYAQVEVRLDERGGFLEKRLFTSSQNELFDRLVLEAVEKSSPFPPPPDSIKSLIKDGIVFGLDSRN